MHTNNFLFQISGGTFHVVMDFPFLQRKFYFFSEKKHFQIWYSRSSLKKKSRKKFTIFFPLHQNRKTKKFPISKISNKKFRKIHYFANIKYKRNSREYCEKIFA